MKAARVYTLLGWILPFIALLAFSPISNQIKLQPKPAFLNDNPALANWLATGGGAEILYAITVAIIFTFFIFLGTAAKRSELRSRITLTVIHSILAIMALGIFYFGLIYISVAYNISIL